MCVQGKHPGSLCIFEICNLTSGKHCPSTLTVFEGSSINELILLESCAPSPWNPVRQLDPECSGRDRSLWRSGNNSLWFLVPSTSLWPNISQEQPQAHVGLAWLPCLFPRHLGGLTGRLKGDVGSDLLLLFQTLRLLLQWQWLYLSNCFGGTTAGWTTEAIRYTTLYYLDLFSI